MAHYALLNENNIVTEVIVGTSEDDTENLPQNFSSWEDYYADLYNASACKRTSYNTFRGEHQLDGTPFRGSYALVDDYYDEINDVFYNQQPYPSWTLDTDRWIWLPPIAVPADSNQNEDISLPVKVYQWNESMYQADNTTGWELTATYIWSSENNGWEFQQ